MRIRITFFILSVFSPFFLIGQDRKFSEELIHELKTDPDYEYSIPEAPFDIWEYLSQHISDFLSSLFKDQITFEGAWIKYAFWGIIIAVLGFSVYTILKSNHLWIFSKNTKVKPSKSSFDYTKQEQIIPLAVQLDEAILNNDFKEAIHIIYLISIDLLDQKKVINLQNIKQHNDIIKQLKNEPFATNFNEIGYYFQYCWYGDFTINKATFDKVKLAFHHFQTSLETNEINT